MNSPILSPLPADLLDSRMGALLIEAGKLTADSAERVLRMQRDVGIRYGEAAMRLGLVSEDDVRQVLARQFGYPYVQPGEASLSPRLIAAYAPFSPQVESLRAIRSQLMLPTDPETPTLSSASRNTCCPAGSATLFFAIVVYVCQAPVAGMTSCPVRSVVPSSSRRSFPPAAGDATRSARS